MSTNDTIMNVRLPKELHNQVNALAKSQMMPMSVLTRLALVEYVKNHAHTALTAPLNNPSHNPQNLKPSSRFNYTAEQEADYDEAWR